ncbi:MAG: hypothetical protein AAFV95_03475 [Bacteroidota bacterium]
MKLKFIFNLCALLFVCLSFNNTATAQTYTDGNGKWVISQVEFSAEDEATLISLLENTNPGAFLIDDNSQRRTYGSMGVDQVELIYRDVADVNPAAGFTECDIWGSWLDCLTKSKVFDAVQAAPQVAEVANELFGKYQGQGPRN